MSNFLVKSKEVGDDLSYFCKSAELFDEASRFLNGKKQSSLGDWILLAFTGFNLLGAGLKTIDDTKDLLNLIQPPILSSHLKFQIPLPIRYQKLPRQE